MDLDDILNSALEEVTLDEEDINKADSDVKKALSSAAATTAKTQDANAQIAASATPSGEEAELANLLKMLGGGGDFDKMLEEVFKGEEFNEMMKAFGDDAGDEELSSLMKMMAAAKEGAEPDPKLMEKIASKLESSIDGDKMNQMLETMMKQVMSKDVMYEPVKKITEEYPKLLSRKGIPNEDRTRYESQFSAYTALRATFENEPENTDKVVQIMQDLEKFGSPPEEILKLLNPEGGMAPPNPNACPTQ